MPTLFLRHALTRLKDAARYGRAAGAAALVRSLVGTYQPGGGRAAHLLAAYRKTFRPFWVRRLARRLAAVRAVSDEAVAGLARAAWARFGVERPIDRSVVVKAPGPGGERGAIVVFPENNWFRIADASGVAEHLAGRYDLILTAGWSPLDYALLELLTRRFPGPIYLQPCNRAEVAKIEAFHPSLKCLPTLGCDWVNPDLYAPRPRTDRPIDLVMVANWGPFKRHWHLFSALRDLPPTLRVVLIGQPDGESDLPRVQRMAADLRVPQQVEFHDRLPVEEVQAHLQAAKVSVVLSRHEGYCGAVTESLFADTPVGLLRDAFIGSKDYINPQTGVLLPHRGLGRALGAFLARAGEFHPRRWAVEHISCHLSLAKVNAVLKADAEAAGRPWTADLAPFCWRPLATLVRREDAARLRPAAEDLAARFPGVFSLGLVGSLPAAGGPK